MDVRILCYLALLLLMVPAAAADGGSHKDPAKDDKDDRASGSHGKKDKEKGGPDKAQNESVQLDASQARNTVRLVWDFQGDEGNVRLFEVYRSTNGGNSTLIASGSSGDRSYTDQSASMGAVYQYVLRVTHMNDAPATSSNSATALPSCEWLNVDPVGSPPVLLHPECLPTKNLGNVIKNPPPILSGANGA